MKDFKGSTCNCGEVIDMSTTGDMCYNCYVQLQEEMRQMDIECENDYYDGLL
jgi:hypothetical protein